MTTRTTGLAPQRPRRRHGVDRPWPAGAWRRGLAREVGGGYDAAGGAVHRKGGAAHREAASADRDANARLVDAVTRLVARPVDELDEPGMETELGVVETSIRRLEARRCRLAAAAAERQAARAAAAARRAGQDEARARERARRHTGDRLAEEHRWTRSDARRRVRTGRQLSDDPGPAQAAFDAGALPVRHAQLLADTLGYLTGDQRREAERRLLAAAEDQDAVAFGRTCRRLLAELDAEAAERAQRRRQARQRATVATGDDGMLYLSGQLTGLDAEYFATAVHAFRRPDRPDEHRRADQATADALVEMARAALRVGEAADQHGVRPHVVVTIDWRTILADAGVAETAWVGPVPYAEVRRLLADAGVSRLLTDADGVPVEAGEAVRTVPGGLWRLLLTRDGGCIADGCDVPAAWCDVMHLGTPFRKGGRLSPDTAALGCRRHHRLHDRHGWQVEWAGGRPVLRAPPAGRADGHDGRDPPDPAGDPPAGAP